MHRNHPSRANTRDRSLEHSCKSLTQHNTHAIRISRPPAEPAPRASRRHVHPGHIVHHASEPSPSDRWGKPTQRAKALPGQTCDRTTGCPPGQQPDLHHTRPETHQNLIHIQKNNRNRPNRTHKQQPPDPDAPSTGIKPNSGHSAIRPAPLGFTVTSETELSTSAGNSAPAHRPDHTSTPPPTGDGGDERVRTDDPLLAKQVLSQLSYTPPPCPGHLPHPNNAGAARRTRAPSTDRPQTTIGSNQAHLVGQGGFEPPTPRLSSVCSNQLSY